jgi:hypothetical protein
VFFGINAELESNDFPKNGSKLPGAGAGSYTTAVDHRKSDLLKVLNLPEWLS